MKTAALSHSPLTRTLRQLVGFNRRETRGFLLLLSVLAMLVLLPSLVGRWLNARQAPVVAHEDVRSLDRLVEQMEKAERVSFTKRGNRSYSYSEPTFRNEYRHRAQASTAVVPVLKTLTPFDPNALSAFEWQQRGVPADVARRLVSYGRKAGGYRYREQFKRIHGLNPQLLAQLTPYIQLPSRAERYAQQATAASTPATATPATEAPTTNRPAYTQRHAIQPFDLNTADSTTLMQLRGIGRKRAARILELREKLGGFISTDQLAEVWGLDAALIDSVAHYARVTTDFQPRPLAINSASLEELRQHPYVGYRLARVLVAFREQHGPFAQAEALRQIKILDDATYQKLLPYVAMR